MPWSTSPPQRCHWCGNVGARTWDEDEHAWIHKYCIAARKRFHAAKPPESTDHDGQEAT